METEKAVICKKLYKNYGSETNEVPALRGIDLEVKRGELLMLAGPSGCGKTTLISIIAGILNQTSGTCSLFGCFLEKMTITEQNLFRLKNIGFVFQSFNLLPTLTSCENVSLPLLISGINKKEAFKKGNEILEKMHLEDKANVYPIELSGGQQQRLAIARAIIHNPRLIVCDEPTSALDGETGHMIMKILKDVSMTHDRTLIVVTHDSRIFQFADRIAEMEDGRIIAIDASFEEYKAKKGDLY